MTEKSAVVPIDIQELIQPIEEAFIHGRFERLALSKYQGPENNLQRITIRPIQIKGELMLSLLFDYHTQHITKNLSLPSLINFLRDEFGSNFKNAHLQTSDWETQYSISKKGKLLINRQRNKNVDKTNNKQEATTAPNLLQHNREKNRFIDQASSFLRELGITDANGQVIPAMSKKWKQINRFIEVLSKAITDTGLDKRELVHIADFGSGKAYLTFAVHNYFAGQLGVKTQVTGVELRQPLVDLCNTTAQKLCLDGIQFEQGDVKHFAAKNINVMIALHACDTATDYAIHMGIRANADIIMCSPCCHKQIRPQLKSPPLLAPLLHHGIHLGQEAEMVTDGLRALLLEANGYDTQVFEFISLEHTSKNKMILAQKRQSPKDNSAVLSQIKAIKEFYGINEHCLETLLLTHS